MDVWEIIGWLAAFCIAAQWIPEIWHAWKYKSLKDVNWMLTFFGILGAVLFLIYSIHRNDWVFIFINGFVGLCLVLIAAMKWKFERK